MMNRIRSMIASADRLTTRYRVILGVLLSVLLSGALALYNVSSGPLRNLNDIGGWSNRALFIVMTAAVHALLLLGCTLLHRKSFARLALRQIILTAGLYILLLGINHKAYVYMNVMQPVIRAMDAGGLAAGVAMQHNMSAPMLTLLYLITRGPVYDMYLLKLFAIGCSMLLSLLLVRAADRRGFGIRAEALLTLCMILPQGFMNAAFSAIPEIAAVTLLAVSLALLEEKKPYQLAACLCFGAACALSGAALYALPLYVYMVCKGKIRKEYLLAAAGMMLAGCVPAMLGGMGAGAAIGSLGNAVFGLPHYASGAPGLMNLVPFARMEQTPQFAPVLRHFEILDPVTHAQPYYTQAHFEQMASGVLLAGLAVYMGVCALGLRARDKSPLHRAMILVLGALIACPNTSSAAWLAMDMVCLYAVVSEPKLRLPSLLVLFATMTSSVYPMTEEVMLPMIYAFVLCMTALCMLLDVIPMRKEDWTNE